MKRFKIEVCALGSYTERDVNCPSMWIGSGCYDVEHECYQEAVFDVAADSLEDALRLITHEYEQNNRDFTNSAEVFYYDPMTIEESQTDDGDAEILDYNYREPNDGAEYDAPSRYCVEFM